VRQQLIRRLGLNMREAMKELFGLVQRLWGIYYIKNKATGN